MNPEQFTSNINSLERELLSIEMRFTTLNRQLNSRSLEASSNQFNVRIRELQNQGRQHYARSNQPFRRRSRSAHNPLPQIQQQNQPPPSQQNSFHQPRNLSHPRLNRTATQRILLSRARNINNNQRSNSTSRAITDIMPPVASVHYKENKTKHNNRNIPEQAPDLHNLSLTETCVICFVESKIYACVPCGHRCFCHTCYRRAKNQLTKCPLCRQPITQFLRIYD